ncbi:ADAMTS-like protein 5 isoform X2 [Cuculus canorus]|uniref:ADAMTS-like protein 5 isoform X2 n=1 Tax=Cuculus canorus TaxID=55661 RepID=UPI0023AB4F08|nr:ADAMTS-like protein 5 isoform X2 [Cuculus canorus]
MQHQRPFRIPPAPFTLCSPGPEGLTGGWGGLGAPLGLDINNAGEGREAKEGGKPRPAPPELCRRCPIVPSLRSHRRDGATEGLHGPVEGSGRSHSPRGTPRCWVAVAAAAPGLALPGLQRWLRAGASPGDTDGGPRAPSPCSAPTAAGSGRMGILGTLELLFQLLRGRRRPAHPEVPAVCRGGAVHGRPATVPALPAPGERGEGDGTSMANPSPSPWGPILLLPQGCPGGSVPFRAMQCSLYDNKPVLGTTARYRWVPFHGAPNVCDLNCLAVGHNFYYSFGRVLDGTRCGPGSPDLCISGRCLSVGCDGILGSGARPDACGQCGGGHDTCLFVHRLFQGADPSSGYFGYMNVTKIPAGATHIKVTDKSRNYLAAVGFGKELERGQSGHRWTRARRPLSSPRPDAVRGPCSPLGPRPGGSGALCTPGFGSGLGPKPSSYKKTDFSQAPSAALPAHAALPAPGEASGGDPGIRAAPSPAQHQGSSTLQCSATLPPAALMTSDGRYVLNGDWSIAWPGPYEVAGTRLLYARDRDGTESLEVPGPTDEDLHLMVLLQEPNPGIEYEFWLPHGHPQPGRGDTSPLRQPQPRGAGIPPPREPPVTPAQPGGSATERPLRSPPGRSGDGAAAVRCGRCHTPKGRSQRIWHFCQSDFVFQGWILARRLVGQETRYEVEVKTPYRHRFPLVRREYVWVPNTCDCPPLREGGEYLLMAQRHVNHEHTLNRILLRDDGYARPWTPREDRLVREAARHCPQPRPP